MLPNPHYFIFCAAFPLPVKVSCKRNNEEKTKGNEKMVFSLLEEIFFSFN